MHWSPDRLTMPPTATGGIARLAVDRLVAAGRDPGPMLRRAGLSLATMKDPRARIAVAAQITLLNLAADALDDELLGFHLAQGFELREIGLLYFVLASSATLGEALARAERYSTLSNEGIVLRCLTGTELCIGYSYAGVPRHADRHQMEFWVTMLMRLSRRLTDSSIRPVRVSLDHPRCGASARLEAGFGCEIAFAAGRDEVVFARGAAQLPLADAEPYLSDLLVRYCEEALALRTGPTSPIRVHVENAIAPLLPHGRARADEVARALGLSRRTLARRLANEGLTFGGVLEEMRRDLALHYLRDGSLSVSRIAWLLGFQEVSAFTHAFKRWTGQTPTQMRPHRLQSPRQPAFNAGR